MIIVMLGPPGAGKGTQCDLLAERLALTHVSTGDLLRDAIAHHTPLGKQAEPLMARGELVSDKIVIAIIEEWFRNPKHQRGAILDGFPRTVPQAQALDEALAKLGRKVDWVIYLRASVEELLQRIAGRYVCGQCGASYHLRSSPPRVPGRCDNCGGKLIQRPDDNIDIARRRMDVYFEQTAPLIDFYRAKRILREINGEQSIDAVLKDELAVLCPTSTGK